MLKAILEHLLPQNRDVASLKEVEKRRFYL